MRNPNDSRKSNVQQPGKKIATIYQTKIIKDNKIAITFFGIFTILILIFNIPLYNIGTNKYYLVAVDSFLIIFLSSIIYFYPSEPFLLYKDGITLSESRLKIFLFRKRNYIPFKNMRTMVYSHKESDMIRFYIHLNEGKKIFKFVDNQNDFDLIINTYKNFKYRGSK